MHFTYVAAAAAFLSWPNRETAPHAEKTPIRKIMPQRGLHDIRQRGRSFLSLLIFFDSCREIIGQSHGRALHRKYRITNW